MISKKPYLPWLIFACASLFFTYEIFQLHFMNVLSVPIMQDLKISSAQLGLISASYLLADILFLIPAGYFLDKLSIRYTLLSSLAICILGIIGFAYAPNMKWAFFFHFFSGIGNAFCFLGGILLISNWFPKNAQAFMVGLMVTIGMSGGLIAQLPLSCLLDYVSWREALLLDAAVGCVLFVLMYLVLQDRKDRIKKENTSLPLLAGLKQNLHPSLFGCAFYTAFMNLPLMIIGAVFGSCFLTQVYQFSLKTSSSITSMICLGTMAGSPFFGKLTDYFQNRKKVMVFGAIASLLLFLSLLSFNPPISFSLALLLFFLIGFFTSTQVLSYPLINEYSPPLYRGTLMGVAAVIIMGTPFFLQPFLGKLLDFLWDGAYLNGCRFYSISAFRKAFLLFPFFFLLALFAITKIKKPTPNSNQ
jgi:MFS family permease